MSQSLRWRMVLASVGVLAASVLFSTLAVLRDMGVRSEQAAVEMARRYAARDAGEIDEKLRDAQLALAMATSNMVWAPTPSVRQAQAFLAERPVLAAVFDAVMMVGADGDLLVFRNEGGLRTDLDRNTVRAVVQPVLAQGGIKIITAHIEALASEPVVVFTQPLRHDDRVVGALCGMYKASTLVRMTGGMSGGIEVGMVDELGRVFGGLRSQQPLSLASEQTDIGHALTAWKAQAALPQDVHIDDAHIVARALVPAAGWTVYRVADLHALLGEPRRARWQAGLLALFCAVCGGLLLLGLLSYLMRPLQQLQDRAQALLDGSLPADAGWPRASGEIGSLSRVLQQVMREREGVARESAELLQELRAVMESSPVGIALSRERRYVLVSREYAAILGCEPQELIGKSATNYLADDVDVEAYRSRITQAFMAGRAFTEETRFQRKDGSFLWCRNQGRAVDPLNPLQGATWVLTDISQEREARERLTWSATHDALTKLLNRPAFEEAVEQRLSSVSEAPTAALLFIDLDRFKAVNDTAGHAAGDAVLDRVAQVLRQRVRTTDLVARLGGDEFAVLLDGCGHEKALLIANSIRTGIEEARVTWLGQSLSVGASVGVAEVAQGAPCDVAHLMAAADAACYEAKRAGRNLVREARNLRLVVGGAPPTA